MKRITSWGLMVCVCALVAGCAKDKNVFVLVPDRDAHVGSISIKNDAGTATLSQENETVSVDSAAAAPKKIQPMDPAKTQQVFGEALAAEPPVPAFFLLYFRSDSAELDAKSKPDLDLVLAEIKKRGSRDISINGHTDTTGDAKYNMKLSMDRATKIKDFLVKNGIDPKYMNVAYHGKGEPLVKTGDNVSEPKNRRVEIIVR
jgi:outer membrane protein OmpA-like peptidoglycan-associated protein